MKIVIFAGGVGSRLWPLSRKNTPKQFENIVGDKSTLQLAIERVLPISGWKDLYISTGKHYKDIIKEQLPELPEENIILEPEMRDVGPAIGLVTAILEKIDPDEPVALLWSDHLMKKEDVFRNALAVGAKLVKDAPEKLVFICQKPRFAAQNLGWAAFGDEKETIDGMTAYEFKGFKYKPALETARNYFKDGHHAWNLGYFVTTPKTLWGLFQKYAPTLYQDLKQIQDSYGTDKYDKVLAEVYPTIEKIHFDNAILENIGQSDAYVLSVDLGWSDIGAWEQLKEALTESDEENATQGSTMLKETRDSLVFNYTDQLVVGIDLDGMIVINTGDVLLVCPKDSVPKIKKVVEAMKGTEYEKLT